MTKSFILAIYRLKKKTSLKENSQTHQKYLSQKTCLIIYTKNITIRIE